MFTHTDTTMNTLITTANGGTVSTSVSPRNSVHTEIASFGIPLCQRNTNESDFLIGENDAISFSIKRGGALVMLRLTLDDEDELIILDAEKNEKLRISSEVGEDWTRTEDPSYWQKSETPSFPKPFITLPAG